MILRMSMACLLAAFLTGFAADLEAQTTRARTNKARSKKVEGHVKKILKLARDLREAGFEEEAAALMEQGKRLAEKNQRRRKERPSPIKVKEIINEQ